VPNGSLCPIGAQDFAWQTGRLGNEVDNPDWMALPLGQLDVVAEPVLQSVGEMQLAIKHHAGEDFTAKYLADRTDAKHRVSIGCLASLVGDVSEAGKGGLTIAYRNEDQAGDVGA